MDPGREAMINGWKPTEDKTITSPRRDPSTRVSKPKKSKPSGSKAPKGEGKHSKYLTLDQQSEKFIAEEDKFVLKQSKKKADIRVRENRAKPIDFLAFNLRFVDADRDVFDDDEADVEIEVPTPEAVLEGLSEGQLTELDEDINSYLTLETNGRNKEYWRALLALCDDHRQKLKPQGPEGRAVSSVSSDIDGILSPKTYEQLEALEKQIKAKLQSDEPIDTDYWEDLLKSLLIWKARAKLKNICEAAREARIEHLKVRDPVKAQILEAGGTLGPMARAAPANDNWRSRRRRVAVQNKPRSSKPIPPPLPPPSIPSLPSVPTPAPALPPPPPPPPAEAQGSASGSGSSAPPPPGTERFATMGSEDFSQATKALYEREVARGVGEGEEIFQAEEALPNVAKPQWANKYRPRKPRYFNRVQMGYEWNKYNQTHYDHENPPPKVVQGYKFNIFYPELIDKTRAPTFKIIREHGRRKGESFAPAGEEDTCLIRFIAGPPYQDIAFRIVDREWDFSAKKERGFRSTFDRGILQLHFQFKKIYYRK